MLNILTAALGLSLAIVPGAIDPAVAAGRLFTLSSPAFSDDGMLPIKYAGAKCRAGRHGGNVSPPLTWANAPTGTKSFAVVMTDPDGHRGLGSVHWVSYGIPAVRSGLKEGEGNMPSPPDIVAGKNSRATLGYSGPCGPPIDAPHHYVIELIALDLSPDALPAGLDRDQVFKAIAGHSLGPASLVVRYRGEE